jgi:hypothetical protein
MRTIARFRDLRGLLARPLLVMALVYCGSVCPITHGAAQEEQDSQLQADIALLDALRSSNNLDALRRQIDLDSTAWRSRGPQAFIENMYRACGELSSYDIGDKSQRALLLGQYAISVLQSDDLSLPQYIQFVEFLGFDPPVIEDAAWKDLRRQKAQFWLDAWLRVSKAN